MLHNAVEDDAHCCFVPSRSCFDFHRSPSKFEVFCYLQLGCNRQVGLWEQGGICIYSFFSSKRIALPTFYPFTHLLCAVRGRICTIRLFQLTRASGSGWGMIILLRLTKGLSTCPNPEHWTHWHLLGLLRDTKTATNPVLNESTLMDARQGLLSVPRSLYLEACK